MRWTYRKAGVDIDAKLKLVEAIKPDLRKTYRPEVMGDVGGFAGLFAMKGLPYRDPVLVSGTDGVGTKLKIAFATGLHGSVGIDLVAMCANDVAVTGADPLFFLDYFATGRLEVEVAQEVIRGIARGCEEAGCALIGGETAELPGFYPDGEYDLAGFCVGAVERDAILDGSRVKPGDAVVGIASSGLHSNGFSLARRVLESALGFSYTDAPKALGAPLGQILLTPTRIYVRSLQALREAGLLHAAAHITGGGWVDNIPRVLPKGAGVRVRKGAWPVPAIFPFLAQGGSIDEGEMYRTFNMGIGMVCVVAARGVDAALAALSRVGEQAYLVGTVVEDPSSAVAFEEG
jgi:phosphoribosylformylglycinamidine cyclo-ligase